MREVHDSLYSWIRLGITLAVACVANVGMWAVIVILPDMQAEFGIARGAAALPYTACMIGFAAGTFTIGRMVDRFGIVPCVIGAALALSAGFALSALAPAPALVAALHLVVGFGTAVGFAPLIADISHWFLARRGIAVSIAASGNYLAGAIWPLALSGLLEDQGWRAVYGVLAVLVLVVVVPLSLLLRRRVPAEAMAVADTAAALRRQVTGLSPRRLQWMLCGAGVACCVAMSMPQVHIVALCVDRGYGPSVGAEMLSLMLMCGVVSRLVFGMVADRIGGLRTLLVSASLQAVALLLFLPAGGLVSLYAVSAVFGLAQGGIVPSYSIVVREYMPAAEAGARVGIVTAATMVGMALGGWMSGAIYDVAGSYTWAFLNGTGWNLINIAIVGTILILTLPGRARPA